MVERGRGDRDEDLSRGEVIPLKVSRTSLEHQERGKNRSKETNLTHGNFQYPKTGPVTTRGSTNVFRVVYLTRSISWITFVTPFLTQNSSEGFHKLLVIP